MNHNCRREDDTSQSRAEILEHIVDEFTARIRSGQHPSISEYQRQHPEHQDEIADLLASVAMIEQLKSTHSAPPTGDWSSLDAVSSLAEIDCYRIIRELGRGGMGVVLEAVHESLGRRVAIKVMPTPLVNSQQFIERFRRESKAAARLHHTNIVGVFGVGEGDGFHYYVMDLVDGKPLNEVIEGLSQPDTRLGPVDPEETRLDLSTTPVATSRDTDPGLRGLDPKRLDTTRPGPAVIEPPARKLTPQHCRWAARLGAKIADALAYAHDSKILHRDIKPSNIMLDHKGVPWITDFGLAKDSASDFNLTKTGDVIGTPQYLAPESLEGKYDQRSEIYCLGLTLYELTTLQPAFAKGTTAEVIRAIATESPVSARKRNPRIPVDLSTIIDKAIARDPGHRYPTARHLRQDLLAFVEDRPIAARRLSTFETVAKWSRRNPLTASLSALSALLLLLVAVSSSIGYVFTMDAYHQEANKSAKLEAQIKQTQIQKLAADRARREAESSERNMKTQFNRAEANVEITIAAFDEMFKQVVARGSTNRRELSFDGFEELQGIETSITKQDAEFLDQFLKFYDQFATENADNESLQLESARAFRRVANIYQLLGEFPRSIRAYQDTIRIYEKRIRQSPESKDVLISLVQTKNELSGVYRRTQDWDNAIVENESAIELLEEVPVAQLDNELRLELAKALNSIGSGSAVISLMYSGSLGGGRERTPDLRPRRRGRPPVWMQSFLEPGMRRRGANDPGRPPERRGRGREDQRPTREDVARSTNSPRTAPRGSVGQRNSGTSWRLGRRTNEYARAAIQILDTLIVENPENNEYRSTRANCYCSLAATLMKPEPQLALQMRDLAIDELAALIAEDSGNPSLRYRHALALSLGEGTGSDDPEGELERLEKSVTIAGELTDQFPKVLDYRYLHGLVCHKIAEQRLKDGDLEAALDALNSARQSFVRVAQQSPTDRARRRAQSLLIVQLGRLIKTAEKSHNSSVSRRATDMLSQVRRASFGRPPRHNANQRSSGRPRK